MGGQEHFYLEPQSTLIWSVDGGNEVHMVSSTQVSNSRFFKLALGYLICSVVGNTKVKLFYAQAPMKHQKYVSHVLGLPMSKVVCKTKRIGRWVLEGRRRDRLLLLQQLLFRHIC